ncbi:adenylyl-sulfate kinase [Paenibacillus sp. PL91]|uniref:adenylyl-sulfate kinase n=1 Tax=Paenibacillus sp. PL91 TaxID=2729538 RepID=UPI00145CA906|nr:adenylyl-sulfate kinase [Paenibacillus sp. PL91]MBC9203017.1 adenylyl-sulfate kinase [Paenibacillus sp. PL91]
MEGNAKNISFHPFEITKHQRFQMNKHRSFVLWVTGLSASGKSSIANEVEKQLYERNIRTIILDGDNLRCGLNRDLGFSMEDRSENVRRTSEAAKLLVDAGTVTIVTLVSPLRIDREKARAIFEEGEFVEVFISCPLDVCEERDPKGLYKKAREGKISEFTGITAPYEQPQNPEIYVSSYRQSIRESAKQIIAYLDDHHHFSIKL